MTKNPPSLFSSLFSPERSAAVPRAAKPDFSQVPPAVLRDLCRLVQASSVTDAKTLTTAGFSVSAAFLLTFDTKDRVFVKGSHPGDQSHGAANLRGEIAALHAMLTPEVFSPPCIGMVCSDPHDDDGWWLGVWPALDEKSTAGQDAPAAMFALLDRFQQSDVAGYDNWPIATAHPYLRLFFNDTHKWRRLAAEEQRRQAFAGCFADPAAAGAWLKESLPFFLQQQQSISGLSFACGPMHGDLRCDNFLFASLGAASPRWWMVDWANAAEGPQVFDRAMLGASLVAAGRLKAKEAWDYMQDATLPSGHVATMLSALAGYFADQIYRERPQALPALRMLQAAMLFGCSACLGEKGLVSPLPPFAQRLLPGCHA